MQKVDLTTCWAHKASGRAGKQSTNGINKYLFISLTTVGLVVAS